MPPLGGIIFDFGVLMAEIKFIVNVSGKRQILSNPPYDDIPCEAGDVLYLPDAPWLVAIFNKYKGNGRFMFVEFKGPFKLGQHVICMGPRGMRGYRAGVPGCEIPEAVLASTQVFPVERKAK